MKFVILDTETTGAEVEDRICQLSFLVTNERGEILEVHDDLCLPPLPVKYAAMAVHHITPEQLDGKPECIATNAFARLQELNSLENVLVIQNAEFDLAMLEKEGFSNRMRLIDTFRILRKVMPTESSHSLQYLRYRLGLYRKEDALIRNLGVEVRAHDALGDVIVLKLLWDDLRKQLSADEMVEICRKPILLEYIPMGRHRGERIEDVALEARNDLFYMLENFDLDQDLRHSLQYWLNDTRNRVRITIGFGKYKGKTPEEVAETDRGYLEWMRDKAERIPEELKAAVCSALGGSKSRGESERLRTHWNA